MMNKEFVLAFFRDKTKRPLGFKEISSLMGLSPSESRALKHLLRQMAKNGEIAITRKGLYGLSEEMNLVTGYFEAHRDGYGFLILEKPGERDVFIPARSKFGAMNNDRVIARLENRQRREGRIIKIIERATTRVIGRLETTKTACYVRPKNKSIPFDLYISPSDRNMAKNGDNVVAEITAYPTDKRLPSGRIVKIIKRPEDPKSEVEAIIEEFNLPRRFPMDLHEEAMAVSAGIGKDIKGRRKDLRSLTTVTIDGERARDFDDAVSVKLTEHGYKLWVHIADVGFFVHWDSALDAEARKRGTSVYFPDRVIPMLPKELSEEICSLKPGVERFAFTVEMDFDRDGERAGARFYPSVIKSNERMTYTSVRKILVDQDRTERRRYDYLLQDFELMNELCGVLRGKRLKRGSLDFDLPEPEVLLDIQGRPESIISAERNLAHMLIEEFMIAANEAVAGYLETEGVPSLYRIHEEPDPMKLEDILKAVSPFLRQMRKSLKPSDFSQILSDIKGTPGEEIINYMILRSLKQARYSSANAGHFGLASESYTHFTSPIRRYPDLVVHRILREVLTKRDLPDKRLKELEALLPDIAFHSSRMERLADEAEREVIDAMRVWFMKDKAGEEYAGRITGITPNGLRVRLRDFYVDGFIRLSYMTDDFYQYNEKTISLTGRHTRRSFKIGDELKVRLDKVDMDEREIVFGICPQD